jgi:hypothetical protein
MILLPWSKTFVASATPTADTFVEVVVRAGCREVAVAAAALFTLKPRLPLRIPRLRGLEEMMSKISDIQYHRSTIETLI